MGAVKQWLMEQDDYSCLECWHSPDQPMSTIWDRQTWEEGYSKGYTDGRAEGHYAAGLWAYSDLLTRLYLWGIDMQVQLHGSPSPLEVIHEVVQLVEHLRAELVGPGRGESHACRSARRADASGPAYAPAAC